MAKVSVPPPPGRLHTTLVHWGMGKLLHRVHPSGYAPEQFNSSSSGSARFSPLFTSDGRVIPTMYAGTTLDCALMETVFHDVPHGTGLKVLFKASHVAGRVHSSLRLQANLRLVDLGGIALRKLGVSRSGLIDTDASEYPMTRRWASAIYEQEVKAQGFLWTSRQADPAQAVILFGDRVFLHNRASGPEPLLLSDGSACEAVLRLAGRLGVQVI